MHVTLYRCFQRLFGSWIINEFLKISWKWIYTCQACYSLNFSRLFPLPWREETAEIQTKPVKRLLKCFLIKSNGTDMLAHVGDWANDKHTAQNYPKTNLQCSFKNLSVSLYPCRHILLNTISSGGNNAYVNLSKLLLVSCILVLRSSIWASFDEMSFGQMSCSPQNGDTVMVSPSLKCWGRLSEIPPST